MEYQLVLASRVGLALSFIFGLHFNRYYMSSVIYHITTVSSWLQQRTAIYYQHSSLVEEGFIHCCRETQIEGVLERYFQGQSDLLLLTVNTELVVSDIRYETATGGEAFPHIYGAIEKAAIVNVEKLP